METRSEHRRDFRLVLFLSVLRLHSTSLAGWWLIVMGDEEVAWFFLSCRSGSGLKLLAQFAVQSLSFVG
jgi:hypothetical protein